ncbi:MAG: hypothetical protein KC589_07380 [Nanoarchaeota archaeon]|nr:hypothetical protein [Nanoarchaeota archaeon]
MGRKKLQLDNSYKIPDVLSNLELSKALTFLGESEVKNVKDWTLSFMEKRQETFGQLIVDLKSVHDSYFTTIGCVCHLIDSGKQLPIKYDNTYIFNKLSSLKRVVPDKAKVDEPKKQPRKLTDAELVERQADTLLWTIDDLLDNFIKTKKDKKLTIPQSIVSASPNVLLKLKEFKQSEWKKEISRINSIKFSEELQEAYSNFSGQNLKTLKEFYTNLIKFLDQQNESEIPVTHPSNSTIKRKYTKRTKTKVAVERLLKTFEFKEEFKGVKSIQPKTILDSTEVYAFDTQYNKLIHLIAKDNEKLTVKGKTIINIDETKSGFKRITTKVLDATIQSFSSGTRASTQRAFNNLKNSFNIHGGRMSADIIILRVF